MQSPTRSRVRKLLAVPVWRGHTHQHPRRLAPLTDLSGAVWYLDAVRLSVGVRRGISPPGKFYRAPFRANTAWLTDDPSSRYMQDTFVKLRV